MSSSSSAAADENDVADFSMEDAAAPHPHWQGPAGGEGGRGRNGNGEAVRPLATATSAAASDSPQRREGENRGSSDGLFAQDLAKLNLDTLAVDTLEVMSRQATVNVGTIGHVAHGKSTVVKALSGVKTQKYHREAVMNITIHLGYANAKVFQCDKCPRPGCFQTYPSSQPDNTPCPTCGEPMALRRHFSFVDCPGHDVLMATMLNGAAIMDAALLLIAANESFPQPQTIEHLAAAEMMRVRHLIVLQNKIDLVKPPVATGQYDVVKAYLAAKTRYGDAPVVPLCAQLRGNVSYLLDYLVHIPLPSRDLACPHARLHVLRSFDVSRPGELTLSHQRQQPVLSSSTAGGDEQAYEEEAAINGDVGSNARVKRIITSVDPVLHHGDEGDEESSCGHSTMAGYQDHHHHHHRHMQQQALAQWLPGGVVGGTVERGILCVGDEIEFLPGMFALTSRDGKHKPTKVAVLRGQTLSYLSAPPPGELFCVPIRTTVESLKAERNVLQYALPGGLVAVGTRLDPSLTRQGKLRGQVMRMVRSRLPHLQQAQQAGSGHGTERGEAAVLDTAAATTSSGSSPVTGPRVEDRRVYQEVDIQFFLLKELLGLSRADLKNAYKAQYANHHSSHGGGGNSATQVDSYRVHPQHTQSLHTKVKPIREGDGIIVNIGTLSTAATVTRTARGAGRALVRLESPICAEPEEKIVLARYVEKKVRLIGWGTIKRGVQVPILE